MLPVLQPPLLRVHSCGPTASLCCLMFYDAQCNVIVASLYIYTLGEQKFVGVNLCFFFCFFFERGCMTPNKKCQWWSM